VVDGLEIAWQHATERTAKWRLEGSADGKIWEELLQGESRPGASRVDSRSFTPRKLRFARLRCFGNDKNAWNSILEWSVGKRASQTAELALSREDSGACRISARMQGPFESFSWTIHPEGRLLLDYAYNIAQPVAFHGLSFEHAEQEIENFSWTGQGPERVWANRMRGTRHGQFSYAFQKLKPGVDYQYPHRAGYYAGVHHAALRSPAGTLRVTCHQDDTFVRVGTNDEGEKIITAWPQGDFSLLHAIPAIGNKFHAPELVSPQGQLHRAPGRVQGQASFQFAP
jgi:hypothetical protein